MTKENPHKDNGQPIRKVNGFINEKQLYVMHSKDGGFVPLAQSY